MDKSISRLFDNKWEREPKKMNRNERGEITTDTIEIERIREYYEKLYANKLDNLEEMATFLETYNLLKLNHEDRGNMKRLITSN